VEDKSEDEGKSEEAEVSSMKTSMRAENRAVEGFR
jgi:hypothetical protein